MDSDKLRSFFLYYFCTGTGGLVTVCVAGFVAAILHNEPLYFLVPFTGYQVQQSRLETPMILFQEK